MARILGTTRTRTTSRRGLRSPIHRISAVIGQRSFLATDQSPYSGSARDCSTIGLAKLSPLTPIRMVLPVSQLRLLTIHSNSVSQLRRVSQARAQVQVARDSRTPDRPSSLRPHRPVFRLLRPRP